MRAGIVAVVAVFEGAPCWVSVTDRTTGQEWTFDANFDSGESSIGGRSTFRVIEHRRRFIAHGTIEEESVKFFDSVHRVRIELLLTSRGFTGVVAPQFIEFSGEVVRNLILFSDPHCPRRELVFS